MNRQGRVWVIDDDRSIRWVLCRALQGAGFQAIEFEDAERASAALDGAEPDVIVSDVRMPGRSGFDLLAELRERAPAVPVIITTAYPDLDSAVSAFQGGAFEHLPKPFDVDEAVELVSRALVQRREQATPGRPRIHPPRPTSSARHRPCRRSSGPSAACRDRASTC